MPTGESEFNEVFFNDVFVPDDDVVGPVDGGWTVARATLGNESVSIGGGEGGMSLPGQMMVAPFDAHPERLAGGAGRVGRYIANSQAIGLLNLRSAHRAVEGAEPGPEGAVTKLVLSENGHEAAAILSELNGPDAAFLDGEAAVGSTLVLMHRAMSIAGGTSEIKRNQIGERILGLPPRSAAEVAAGTRATRPRRWSGRAGTGLRGRSGRQRPPVYIPRGWDHAATRPGHAAPSPCGSRRRAASWRRESQIASSTTSSSPTGPSARCSGPRPSCSTATA